MAKKRSVEDLMSEYRTLAKRADERMVRLEKYAKRDEYKGILKMAYRRAQYDLKRWSSKERQASGKPLRFNTAPPKTKTGKINVTSLEAKINTIKRFLASQSSTIKKPKEPFAGETGVEAVYKKRVETLNERWGTDFTWQELAKFFDSGLADKLEKFGSDVKLRMIAVVQANKEDVKKAIEEGKKHIDTDINPFEKGEKLDPFLKKKVNKMIKEYGNELLEFIEG